MVKIVPISNTTAGFNSANKINDSFDKVEAAFINTLSRDGSAPNTMLADFDMNSNDILNAGDIYADNIIVRGTVTSTGDLPVPATGDLTTFTYGTKPFALNRSIADTMSADLTDRVGYAATADVTGGGSGDIYWVTTAIADDEDIEGTLRWAVEQVRTSGVPGRVLFDPRASFDVVLTTQLEPPADCTIDAPGRNARIWRNTDVTGIKVVATNNIIRRLSFGSLVTGSATERDGLWVDPSLSDSFWVDSCTFSFCGDGALEVVSVADPTVDCYGSITNCLFRYHDKVSLIGSLACYQDSLTTSIPAYCSVTTPHTPVIFVTINKCVYEYTSERNPKVLPKAFVHSVNNVRHLAPILRDDGSTAAVYGIYAGTGGQALSEGDLFTSAATTGWKGIETATGTFAPRVGAVLAVDGIGFTKATNSVVADSIVLQTAGDASVTVPPYSLTVLSISDSPEGHEAFKAIINATVGAEVDAAPKGTFVYDETSTEIADGIRVLSVAATGAGRWARTDGLPARIEDYGDVDRTFYAERGNTLTIASGAITLPEQGTHFAIATEGAAASDTLSTINGSLNGRILILRPASTSGDVILDSAGNINVGDGTRELLFNGDSITLIYDTNISKFTPIASTQAGYKDVRNVHLAHIAPNVIKGRVTSGTGVVEDLTATQAAAIIGSSFATYADNAAAVSGGLAVGTLYKTATGEVRIVV